MFFFFFERGLGKKKSGKRGGKQGRRISLFSLSLHTRSLDFCLLAREGSGHVGLADGGLGGQDGDLKRGE